MMIFSFFLFTSRVSNILTPKKILSFPSQTGDGDMENSIVLQPNQTIENRGDKSYLIVWQI